MNHYALFLLLLEYLQRFHRISVGILCLAGGKLAGLNRWTDLLVQCLRGRCLLSDGNTADNALNFSTAYCCHTPNLFGIMQDCADEKLYYRPC